MVLLLLPMFKMAKINVVFGCNGDEVDDGEN